MKISVNELRGMIGEIVAEAKKKNKDKSKKPTKGVKPNGFSFDEAFDFSAPLGAHNLYALQGASNWGPLTGPGTHLADGTSVKNLPEQAVRALVRQVISEQASRSNSAWSSFGGPKNVWTEAMHYYDNQKLGLGKQTSEGIQQKKADKLEKDKKSKKKGRK